MSKMLLDPELPIPRTMGVEDVVSQGRFLCCGNLHFYLVPNPLVFSILNKHNSSESLFVPLLSSSIGVF